MSDALEEHTQVGCKVRIMLHAKCAHVQFVVTCLVTNETGYTLYRTVRIIG